MTNRRELNTRVPGVHLHVGVKLSEEAQIVKQLQVIVSNYKKIASNCKMIFNVLTIVIIL